MRVTLMAFHIHGVSINDVLVTRFAFIRNCPNIVHRVRLVDAWVDETSLRGNPDKKTSELLYCIISVVLNHNGIIFQRTKLVTLLKNVNSVIHLY